MKELAKSVVRKFLSQKGLAVIRVGDKNSNQPSLQYIAAGQIVSAAERERLSVCDYVENLWGQQGGTQQVIDRMASCGVFEAENPVVLEIGPGTGRYLEKILTKLKPARYEIYESCTRLAEWLQSRYPVVLHEADGASLKQTAARFRYTSCMRMVCSSSFRFSWLIATGWKCGESCATMVGWCLTSIQKIAWMNRLWRNGSHRSITIRISLAGTMLFPCLKNTASR